MVFIPGKRIERNSHRTSYIDTIEARMKKILSFWIASFLMAFSFASHADAETSLGLQAKQFYVWYINKQENQVFPLLDHEIGRYVDASTVESLRRDYKRDQLPGGADYFLKVQDYDERDWLAHIKPSRPLTFGDAVVVPVSFGARSEVTVLVFFTKQHDGWKIIKVDDMLPYSSPGN
ncbi:hypothetical protein [Ralstonia sp.]|uniref:hypothetical protein n=1 Tax=Ralstonia sp. TaxID=54061 RepID=UPI002BE1ACAB|nr:hypothetical protein [Ralstonia sp.]HWV06593.1 hypothetical protein [Ralstonia sp.]